LQKKWRWQRSKNMFINPAYFSDRKLNLPPMDAEEVGEVCIANISPLERQKRLRFGIAQFTVTLVIFGVMVLLQLNPLWRLLLLFLFWASAIGYFQAKDKT
jgi:hypothetical protein